MSIKSPWQQIFRREHLLLEEPVNDMVTQNNAVITVGELIKDLSVYPPHLPVYVRDPTLDLGNVPVLRQSYAAPRSPSYLDGALVVIIAGEN